MVGEKEVIIRTLADQLLELVKKHKGVSMRQAASMLNVSSSVLEDVVEFFVEARILDWDYKFTTPYIMIHKDVKDTVHHLFKKHDDKKPYYIDQEFFQESKTEGRKNLKNISELFHKDDKKDKVKKDFRKSIIPTHLPQFSKESIDRKSKSEIDDLQDSISKVKKLLEQPKGTTIFKLNVSDRKLLSKIINEKMDDMKQDITSKGFENKGFTDALNEKVELAAKEFLTTVKEDKEKKTLSKVAEEKIKNMVRDYFESQKDGLKVQIVKSEKKVSDDQVVPIRFVEKKDILPPEKPEVKEKPKHIEKKHLEKHKHIEKPKPKHIEKHKHIETHKEHHKIEKKELKPVHKVHVKVIPKGRAKVLEEIKEIKRLIKERRVKDAEEKSIQLWLDMLELKEVDKKSLKHVAALTDGLENMFKYLWDDFVKKRDKIENHIKLAKSLLKKNKTERAMRVHNWALKLESTLSRNFPEDRKKVEHSLMKLNLDLIGGYVDVVREQKVEHITKRLMKITKQIHNSKSKGNKRSLIGKILKVYEEIPSELFQNKYTINKQLIKLYNLLKKDKKLNGFEKTHLRGQISDINNLISQKDLLKAEKIYIDLWRYVLTMDVDKHFINEMNSINNKLHIEFKNQWNEFKLKIKELHKKILDGHQFIVYHNQKSANQSYQGAVNIEVTLPQIFEDERKKAQNLIMKLYIDLANTFIDIKHDTRIKNINTHMHLIMSDIEKAKNTHENRVVMEDILNIYREIPPELFEHKTRISKQLLTICEAV
tara:strand:- start:18670 stop:20967 length:2298 start_codon:yes stop_codon:yes gene_type:complete